MKIVKLCDIPKLAETAALWYSSKWGIPADAYRESIGEFLTKKSGVPQWFLALNDAGDIIGGAGIIENDFHERKDLAPNLCALFVEPDYRNQGIARNLLNFGRKAAGEMGFDKLYLITDHTDFYEKCGWTFLTMVQCDEGEQSRMYVAETF